MKVEIKNIRKCYGKKEILKDINLSAESGRCVGIFGANGCGKSTLLSILAGINLPEDGEFLCDGMDLLKDKKLRKSVLGYVPQGAPLIEELSARDNLLLWYDKNDMKKELQDGILKVLGIDEFCDMRVSKMSGGMKKRLSIGCSMANHPTVMALDEPMAALDLSCKQKIVNYFYDYKKNGGIIFLVTHDMFGIELCDECYILKDGFLEPYIYDGNFEELVKRL